MNQDRKQPQQDPAEGAPDIIDRQLGRQSDYSRNRRETGARKPMEDRTVEDRNPTETHDAGDQPKEPYGLTEPASDRDSVRHSDGQQPPGSDSSDLSYAKKLKKEADKRPL